MATIEPFAQVAKSVLMSVLQEGAKSERLDVVFNVYHQPSINDAEQVNQGADSAVQTVAALQNSVHYL